MFVKTRDGYINANHILQVSGQDETVLTLADGRKAQAQFSPAQNLVSLLPAGGEFEVVDTYQNEDGVTVPLIQPVFGWGLRMDGEVVPLTPYDPVGEWPNGVPAVRRVGAEELHSAGTSYDNLDDYLGR